MKIVVNTAICFSACLNLLKKSTTFVIYQTVKTLALLQHYCHTHALLQQKQTERAEGHQAPAEVRRNVDYNRKLGEIYVHFAAALVPLKGTTP